MDYFFDLWNLLYLAQGAFTIWMLIDAYQRRVEYFWYMIIFFVPVLGAWVYFFMFKAGDFRWLRDLPMFQRKVPLDELRHRANQVPTLANRLALAERLVELKSYTEAAPLLEAVLKQEPDLSPGLYNLAVCHAEQGRAPQAVALLEKLVARDGPWSNYSGYHLLIQSYIDVGERDKALQTSRDAARLAPTMHHKCLLAEQLIDKGLKPEAADVLVRALEEHRYAPGFVKRREAKWAAEARRLHRLAT